MDNQEIEKRQIDRRKKISLWSKFTFWYTKSTFQKGYRRDLEEEDLYEVEPEFETSLLGDRIETQWEKYKHDKKLVIFCIFWNMFGKSYTLLGFFMYIIYIIFNVVRPIFLGKLVSYFTPGQKELSKKDAYLYALILIGLHLVDVICRQNYYFIAESQAIRLRTALCSLIYRKILKFPSSRLRQIHFGKVANLITRDINFLMEFFWNFNLFLAGLIIMVILLCNMYHTIGLPTIAGVVALAIIIPFQVIANIWISYLKNATSHKTDVRIGVLQEALTNIRTMKMYVREKHTEEKITEARKNEMNISLKMCSVLFASIATATIVHNVALYLVLMTFIWLEQPLSAQNLYFITGTFLGIAYSISVAIPYGTFHTSQLIVALKRMQNLIFDLEVESKKNKPEPNTTKARVQMKNVTVNCGDKTILRNVSFNAEAGLTVVTGQSSSGKTALLLTILREFELFKGSLLIDGKISYASQEPWLFPSTIRQNILFGSEYNEKRYEKVVEVCSLEYDFNHLEDRDYTVVADRGRNLSKGQQCRINLARALYKECDIYLLDDCLSSLDTFVTHSIFSKCIMNFLSNKIVFLVTHDCKWKLYANSILKLDHGNVNFIQNCSPQKLIISCSELDSDSIYLGSNQPNEDNNISSECPLISNKSKLNKIYSENKAADAVSTKIFKKYINLGGGVFWVVVIFGLFVMTQLSQSYKEKLISEWANLEDQVSQLNVSVQNQQYLGLTTTREHLIYKYSALVVGLSLCVFLRAFTLFTFSKRISINLHRNMTKSVLNAPLSYFDHTFIGNIINRFSKDVVIIDESLPFPIHHLIAVFLESFGNLVLISSTVVPLLFAVLLLIICCVCFRHIYLKTGRSLKRLEATTKSPVIGYLNATLEGLPTIKVFNAENILKEEFEQHHNVYNSASYVYLACIKAYTLAVDLAAALFLATTILQFVIFDKGVSPGDVGLVISLAFYISHTLFYCTSKIADVETQMTSVERTMEYIDVRPEARSGLKLKNWPSEGEIRYENVYLSVNQPKSYLLKNINFVIKPREKIGIIGRTGAGKSSIVSALFRLYETEGRITIDNVDIKTLSLDFLRSSLSVIPQDPVLFNGSLRENIDPDKLCEDEAIWNILDAVHLKEGVTTLDIDVKELGFTCGQKQLLCLARVLIQNKKILVLDEIVENVDSEAERLISRIIEDKFSSLTVIKIAHKLKFVLNCDKILVISNGEVVEWDSPNALLQNENSIYYKMVETCGIDSSLGY